MYLLIGETLLESIFEFLFITTGAFILWAKDGFKGDLTTKYELNRRKSAIAGFFFWLLIFLILGVSGSIIRN